MPPKSPTNTVPPTTAGWAVTGCWVGTCHFGFRVDALVLSIVEQLSGEANDRPMSWPNVGQSHVTEVTDLGLIALASTTVTPSGKSHWVAMGWDTGSVEPAGTHR